MWLRGFFFSFWGYLSPGLQAAQSSLGLCCGGNGEDGTSLSMTYSFKRPSSDYSAGPPERSLP